ncbi:MAG TPA: GAF domain-containing protein [Polyangiales bacterium]|nr:GAF domain-containing protein [Polyangiales bacterium]
MTDREEARPALRGGEAVQRMRQSLERVDRERQGLVKVAASLEDFVRTQDARFAELEQELNDTALLYVASYQLQARDEPREVLRHLRELLEQLIGVESFALYLGGPEAKVIASRGLLAAQLAPQRTDQGPLAPAYVKKAPILVEGEPLPTGTLSTPLAVVPLLLAERVVGAISIVKLFPHKQAWASVDVQLLNLLATHAASALLAAHLVRQAQQSDLLGTLATLGEGLE